MGDEFIRPPVLILGPIFDATMLGVGFLPRDSARVSEFDSRDLSSPMSLGSESRSRKKATGSCDWLTGSLRFVGGSGLDRCLALFLGSPLGAAP